MGEIKRHVYLGERSTKISLWCGLGLAKHINIRGEGTSSLMGSGLGEVLIRSSNLSKHHSNYI